MAVTTSILSGNVLDLILTAPTNPARIKVALETNSENGALADTAGNRLMLGPLPIPVGDDGLISATIIRTDSPDVLPAEERYYRLTITYPDAPPRANQMLTLTSPWFEVTAATKTLASAFVGADVIAVSADMAVSLSEFAGVAATAIRHIPTPSATPSANQASIQSAIDSAAAAGGGEVRLAPGQVYVVDLELHPATPTIASALRLDDNVHLNLNGSTIRLADGVAAPAGMSGSFAAGTAQMHLVSVARPYSNLTPGHQNIRVTDGVIDGRSSAQASIGFGLWISRARSVWVRGVKVLNVRGTGSAPPGETFFFEALNSTEVHYDGCEAICDDASSTGAGFSANNSTNVTYTDCTARGMTFSGAFTHWQCAGITYTACKGYGTAGFGFNSERSEGIKYVACDAGFRSAPVRSITGSTTEPGPNWSSVQQQTGNAFGGFACQGSKIVEYVACVARYNTSDGLQIKDNTSASPTIPSDQIRVVAGQYGPGNGRGITVAATSTNVVFVGHVDTTGNTAVDVIGSGAADNYVAAYGAAPFHTYKNLNDTSGMRFNVVRSNGTGAPTGSFAYRWSSGGTLVLTVNPSGDLIAGRAVRPAAYATASRPTAASVGAGAMIYDTTLSKPIWSDGTVWRDAAGTTV